LSLDLEYPDILALGAQKTNNVWAWSRSATNPFENSKLVWTAIPTTVGDCVGYALGKTSGVTFPCSETKRVVCEQ